MAVCYSSPAMNQPWVGPKIYTALDTWLPEKSQCLSSFWHYLLRIKLHLSTHQHFSCHHIILWYAISYLYWRLPVVLLVLIKLELSYSVELFTTDIYAAPISWWELNFVRTYDGLKRQITFIVYPIIKGRMCKFLCSACFPH